jgi:parallel beta-helix repeat protein
MNERESHSQENGETPSPNDSRRAFFGLLGAAGAAAIAGCAPASEARSETVSAGLTFTKIDSCDTMSDLSATTPTAATLAIVLGYTVAGDGGGGYFEWSTTSTAAADGVWVVNPTGHSGAGRWLRRALDSNINVRWYGVTSSSDLGAVINAIDTYLGSAAGTIEVPDGNWTIATQIVLSANRTLILGTGTYSNTLTSNQGALVLYKSNTTIRGKGWQTIVNETASWGVFADWNGTQNNYNDGASNVTIRDLQIAGAASSFNSSSAAIGLGNGHNIIVDHIYLNATKAIGIVVGGGGDNGHYSNGVWVKNCLCDHVASQNIAVVNAANVHIEGNTLRAAGQTGGPGATYIDFEPNGTMDRIENFHVGNNLIDARGSANPGNGIVVQSGGSQTRLGPGSVTGNVIIGGEVVGTTTNELSNGIFLSGFWNVLVGNNTVRRCGQSGIYLYICDHCTVQGNCLVSVGGGGLSAISIVGNHNQILSNSVMSEGGTYGSSSNAISEGASSDYNTFFGNFISNFVDSDTSLSYYVGVVTLSGAHSSAFGNNMNGRLTNQGGSFGCVAKVTASRAITLQDDALLMDTTAGAITLTLPDATEDSSYSVPTAARRITIRLIAGTNSVTVAPTGTQTINGSSSLVISDTSAHTLQSDGSNWWTM